MPQPPGRVSGYGGAADVGRPGLFQVLWRRKWLVVITVAAMIVLAFVYLITEPRRYLSNDARLLVHTNGDNSEGNVSPNFLNTQAEKIMSREVLFLALAQPVPDDAVLPELAGDRTEDFALNGVPMKAAKFKELKLKELAQIDPKFKSLTIKDLKTFKESEYAPSGTLRNSAQVEVGKKDDALRVGFETPYPHESPIIANAIVEAYALYQKQPKRSNATDALEAYRSQKTKKDAEMSALTDKMNALEQQYGVLSKNGDDNLAVRQLASTSQRLVAAHGETLRAKADWDEAARATARDPRLMGNAPAPIDTIISADDEQMLRANLTQLQSKLRDMRTHYMSDHPALRALEQKVNEASVAYGEAVRRRWLRAQQAEDDLNTLYKDQNKQALVITAQAAHYARLKDDADFIRNQLVPIETSINAAEVQQAAPAIYVDFFDHADFAHVTKSHPSGLKSLSLALVLGLILGCGVALVRDRLDDRLHSSDEIKSSLGIPLLGSIPQMPGPISPGDAGQHVVIQPADDVAEAFRSVRTAITFGSPKDRCKTLLVTSPSAGDGKSTMAANLAIVTAQAGKKVLLIDADLRNPRLNTIFSLGDVRVGLSSLLNGQGTWEQAIQHSPVNGLDLLPCGPRPRNASEMLNSPMFSELLEMLADTYDQIIIDSPPVMGLADARIIAASCDVTVLVLRAGKSTRKLSTLAQEGLAGVGANVIGVIVNDVSRRDEVSFEGSHGYPYTSRQQAPEPAAEPAVNDVRTNVLARRIVEVREEAPAKPEAPIPTPTAAPKRAPRRRQEQTRRDE